MTHDREYLSKVVARIPSSRHLMLGGILSNDDSRFLIRELQNLEREPGDVLFKIDSSIGGHYDAGVRLYYAFKGSPCRIVGLVEEEASSAAFMALQGCMLRIARKNSILTIHNPENFPPREPIRHDSKEDEYKERAAEEFRKHHPVVVKNREETIRILLDHTIMSRSKLEDFLERRTPLAPEEAIRLGFLDGIIHIAVHST